MLPAPRAWAADVWLDVMVVHASKVDKGCDARLAPFESELREAIPSAGYRLVSQDAKRVSLRDSVSFDLGNRHEVYIRPVAAGDDAVDLQLLVVDGSTVPAKRMRQAVKVMYHKAFAIGHPLPDGSSKLLLIQTGP